MYELGDKVIYQGVDEKVYKKHGVVKSIEEKHGKPQLTVELENGETFTAPIDDWSREFSNACTSTNAVIRNAVAARNGKGRRFGSALVYFDKFDTGNKGFITYKGKDYGKEQFVREVLTPLQREIDGCKEAISYWDSNQIQGSGNLR